MNPRYQNIWQKSVPSDGCGCRKIIALIAKASCYVSKRLRRRSSGRCLESGPGVVDILVVVKLRAVERFRIAVTARSCTIDYHEHHFRRFLL